MKLKKPVHLRWIILPTSCFYLAHSIQNLSSFPKTLKILTNFSKMHSRIEIFEKFIRYNSMAYSLHSFCHNIRMNLIDTFDRHSICIFVLSFDRHFKSIWLIAFTRNFSKLAFKNVVAICQALSQHLLSENSHSITMQWAK